MQVASRIKELREISGYSRHAVAKLVGVEYDTYKDYEESGADIPISVLYKLANEFGVDFTEILTGKSRNSTPTVSSRRIRGLILTVIRAIILKALRISLCTR